MSNLSLTGLSSFVRRRWVRFALLAALALSYFGSLWLGALQFPHPYDWRRNVISNLLSPRDNPTGYWLPTLGISIAGFCMLPLAAWIDAELGSHRPGLGARLRRPALLMGIVCLVLAAIVSPQHIRPVLGMRHAHEVLARTSAAGMGISMLAACASLGGNNVERRLRGLRRMWQVTVWPAMAFAVSTGVIVATSRWIGTGTAAMWFRSTMFWHLAFWEWSGSVVVFFFFLWPVFMLGDDDRASASGMTDTHLTGQ